MSIVPLTIIISLCLVFSFVVFFLREHARNRVSSAERDSLLPLAEETPRLAGYADRQEDDDHACGCQDGRRAPCAGCLRRSH